MDQWLDCLTEDWISEPLSTHSNSSKEIAPSPGSFSPKSNLTQSRIPRYKARSTSSLSVGDITTPKRRLSSQADRRTTIVLNESSSSNLNASHAQGPRGASKPSSPLVRSLGKRAGSTGSLSFVPQDTVQHRPPRFSSAKDSDLQNTPDWKRRILQGKVAPGEQCDLFSPIGLEKVFRPPTAGSKGKVGRVITAKCRQTEDYPSSPPLPSVSKESPVITSQDRGHPETPVLPTRRNVKTEPNERDRQGALRVAIGNQKPSGSGIKKQSRISNLSGENTSQLDSAGAPPSEAARGKRQDRLSSATPSNISGRTNHNQLPKQGLDSSIQQDYRNENISPFFVSRHQTIDGQIDYAAIDLSMDQLRCQMDKLRLRQQSMPSSRSSDNGIDYTEAKYPEDSFLPEFENDWTSHSLPDDLSMGTDAFEANGGFVNLRRGGYSNDGSFQKRPLSPSSLPAFDNSEYRSIAPSSERSRRGEKPAAVSLMTTPALPTTPRKRESKEQSSPARTQSSGSPLKLFDKYDTFTKDRMSRRISEFEENLRESPDQQAARYDDGNRGSSFKISRYPMLGTRQNEISTQPYQRNERRVSSFGEGELDNHSFCSSQPSKPSFNPVQGGFLHFDNKDEGDSSASHFDQELSPKSPTLRIASSGDFGNPSISVPHNPVKAISHHARKSITPMNGGTSFASINEEIPKEDVHNAQGKRLPRSPVKDSQPKRRRTLRRSDDIDCEPQQASLDIKVKIPLMNSVVGRKRKDALYDGENQVADPEILAMRTILRPRTSTTSHNEFSDRGIHVNTLIRADNAEIKTVISAQGQPALRDPPTAAVAKQPASFALDRVQNETKGSRKASVNTADFFNEAQQIMRVIRAQGRPQSSQESIPKIEPYRRSVFEESVVEESPKDEFSRPPSRAGLSLRRLREPVQYDARVVSHLRKFEEKGDFEVGFSSSFRSIQLEKVERESKKGENNPDDENVVESDPPNVRIYRQLSQQDSQKLLPIDDPPSLTTDTKTRSLGSLASGPSTGRSLHTRSSHGSGSKAMIVPETVSHLLSDQIAGMKYDQERQVWIKSQAKEILKAPYQTSSEMTEDALGEIPDLSVDELEEMQRIKDHASSINKLSSGSNGVSSHDYNTHGTNPFLPNDDGFSRPRTAEGAISASEEEDSPARSKYSRLASSGSIPETRATSWGGDVSPAKQQGSLRWDRRSPVARNDNEGDHEDHEGDHEEDHEEDHDNGHDEDVEHEISILEGRSSKTPTRSNRRGHQARVVTVSFSSPLVGQIETPHPPDSEPEVWEDGSDLDLDDSPIRLKPQPGAPSSRRRSSFERRSSRRTSSRRVSIGSQSYIARPMSRLDEQDEIAFLQDSNGFRKSSMNVIVSTPLSPQRSLLAPNPPSNDKHSSIGFHLSPLQDFSVHQIDKSTDQGYGDVVRRRGLLSAHEIEKFALVTQHLVQKLTDIEPHEPYWDLIQRMNLQSQGLITLHKLDEFCGRLEELNVSNNSIGQLDGAPSSIRDLKICRNNLSDLSAWGHLHNLQYLDVSRNHIRSFKGFQKLIHLRELKADDNEIESLDGLLQLDGLLSLRLRGNLVSSVDFQGSNLKRLTTLDMYGNMLVKVSHLHHLPAIRHVNFGENQLQDMKDWSYPSSTLETLNIPNNGLLFFDSSCAPNLRSLNLDRNSICSIRGIAKLKRLETLSWREQSLTTGSDNLEIQYQEFHDVHHLHLSNNILTCFTPSTPFLNLRTLEVASTGLQKLCPRFGYKVPNLRILNLNYNAIGDLRPLTGIVRLQTLLLAGNRISRLRQTFTLFQRIGRDMIEVDLRHNPLTLGFYTPQDSLLRPEKQITLHKNPDSAPAQALDSQESFHLENSTQAYRLPPLDADVDNQSRARLDKDTMLRRKVYEMMVVESCEVLMVLDGLQVGRKRITEGEDGVIRERLNQLGILAAAGAARQ